MPSAKDELESQDTVGDLDSPKFDPKSKLLNTQDSISHNKMVQIRNQTYKDEHTEKKAEHLAHGGDLDQYGDEKDLLQPKLLKTQDSVMLHRNTLEDKKKNTDKMPEKSPLEPATFKPTFKHQDSIMLNRKHIQERHYQKPAILELPSKMKEGDEIDKGANDKSLAKSASDPQPKPRFLNSSLEEMKPLDPKARRLDSLPRIRNSGKVKSYVGSSPEQSGERELQTMSGSPSAPEKREGGGNINSPSQGSGNGPPNPKSKSCVVS